MDSDSLKEKRTVILKEITLIHLLHKQRQNHKKHYSLN